jgi:3-(3-hydroxy-phenyl)propionate hydroxylase
MLLFVANVESLGAATREIFVALAAARIPVHTLLIADREGPAPEGCTLVVDHEHLVSRRLDGRPGTAYLLRPDQHVCARWRRLDLVSVQDAVARATGNA